MAVSPAGWFFIGAAVGLVVGVILSTITTYILRRQSNGKPHIRSNAVGASCGVSSVAPRAETSNMAVSYHAKSEQEVGFFSPLQSSIAQKPGNALGSTNMSSLPDPAAYGSHGIAILHVNHPAPSPAALSTQPSQSIAAPQPSMGGASDAHGDAAPAVSGPSTRAPEPPTEPLLGPSSRPDTAASSQPPPSRQTHQRMFSVADAYGAEDLDDEWAVVLGDLDGLLAKKGQPGLASPERAVAVRRLIAVTGSRGMQHALEAALQDVLRFRSRQ